MKLLKKKDTTIERSKLPSKVGFLCLVLIIMAVLMFHQDIGSLSPLPAQSLFYSTAMTGEDQRWLKYFRTYRYVPPASRYDYIKYPAKECGSGPSFSNFFTLSHKIRSRLNEDKFLYETLFSLHNVTGNNGTYVELGAFDGSQESNTHFFDKCLGWKGLLLEGNPENYQKVISNRPFAHKMSIAPSCSAEYELENKTIPFYRYPMTNVGLPGHAKTYQGKPTVDVPCGPLTPILEDVFGGTPIFLFSLDVEGSEKLVLDTLDFTKVVVYVLMIEIQNDNCKTDSCIVRQQVRDRMKKEGYKRYEGLVHASDIYVHPHSPFQIPESIALPK